MIESRIINSQVGIRNAGGNFLKLRLKLSGKNSASFIKRSVSINTILYIF